MTSGRSSSWAGASASLVLCENADPGVRRDKYHFVMLTGNPPRGLWRSLFEGEVERGRDYLLVDDFVGQGGTIANLKGFIESRGGTAIGCTTLTGKPWSAKLTPSVDTLRMLRDKHGGELESWWKDTFGYGFDFLTESEARYLARADSVELIRNRILAARQAHDD